MRYHGGVGNNQLFGGSGRDLIIANIGNDKIDGGSGTDTISYASATSAVKVDLHVHTGNGYGHQTIKGVENVIGSKFGDTLIGDKRANVIDGGFGDDIIRGYTGADTMTGGAGKDVFVFTKKDIADGSVDHITDFKNGEDRLNLSHMAKAAFSVTDAKDGTHISVGGHEFLVLDNVHQVTLDNLIL